MIFKISLSNIFTFCCNSIELVISSHVLFIIPSFDQVKVKSLNWNFGHFEFCAIVVIFKIVFVFWFCLKTPNLKFLNLVIPHYSISLNFWNFGFSNSVPYFCFLKRLLYAGIVEKYTNSCLWVWLCHSK